MAREKCKQYKKRLEQKLGLELGLEVELFLMLWQGLALVVVVVLGISLILQSLSLWLEVRRLALELGLGLGLLGLGLMLSLRKRLRQSCNIIISKLVRPLPEDYRANLNTLRYRLIKQKRPQWRIRFIITICLLSIYVGWILVNLQNIWSSINLRL